MIRAWLDILLYGPGWLALPISIWLAFDQDPEDR